MKKFFAILVVALLATSYAFSQTYVGADGTGDGKVVVSVYWEAITCVTDATDINLNMNPGQPQDPTLARLGFTWIFKGARGIDFTASGDWVDDANFDMSNGTLTQPTTFDAVTGLATITLPNINVFCHAGTEAGVHTLTYNLLVEYN